MHSPSKLSQPARGFDTFGQPFRRRNRQLETPLQQIILPNSMGNEFRWSVQEFSNKRRRC